METDPGIMLPIFLLIPENNTNRRPAVIALAEGGKEGFLSRYPNEVAFLLNKGITVCLPDLRGSGELNSSNSRSPGAMSLAGNELMLGGTLTGSRLKDARTLFRWLEKRPDIDPENIAIWGDSFSEPNTRDFQFDQSPGQQPGPIRQRQVEPLGSFLALLTGLYEDNISAIACRGGLISFLSVLQDNFCHIPQDVVVPGILEVTDIPYIVQNISPRPVMLAEMVDGLNKRVSGEILQNEYGTNIPGLTLEEDTDNVSIAQWLVNQCLKNQK